jgi:hypothetical protein
MGMNELILGCVLGLSLVLGMAARGSKRVNLLVTPVLRRADVEVLAPYREHGGGQ